MTASDPAFPTLHIRPERGWLNDPNGLSYVDGVYHVFFQYNPYSARHHAIRWGHASSTDLLRWRYEPDALVPRPGFADAYGCWSGTVTMDDGRPTAVYSAVVDPAGASQVMLAHSDRAMLEWVQEVEPVIGMPDDHRVTDVRDPFVLMVDGHRWALQGAGLASGHGALLAYACDDLHSWSYRGIVLDSDHAVAAAHAPAVVWECPQLVQVDEAWVLIVSPVVSHGSLSSGPPSLGPVAWLTGELSTADGALTFAPTSGGLLDSGPDFYAPQAMALADRVLVWGWSFEDGRTPEETDAAGWAGVLTFPRELQMIDGALRSRPGAELTGLRRSTLYEGSAPTGGQSVRSPAFEIEFAAASAAAPMADAQLRLGLSPATDVCQLAVPAGRTARVLVDASIIEIFVDGQPARTIRAYPGHEQEWHVEATSPGELIIWDLSG